MRQAAALILVLSGLTGQFAPTTGEITVLGIRVSFQQDTRESTTGDGKFLQELAVNRCGDYLLDPPPHNRTYFEAQLKSVNSYFSSVSRGRLVVDLVRSHLYPREPDSSYSLKFPMNYFHPFGDEELQDRRLAELYQMALQAAYETDSLQFDLYDVIAVFHAGIGQDFSLPFLDPTPEDIPSAYIDLDFLAEQLEEVQHPFPGIVLPETQNHLLYDVAEDIFAGVDDLCDYQFGLTGTFSLMMGFALGLPPLWDTETGESGVGVFALMDQGSNNGRGIIPAPPDPWTRIHAGWESATTLTPTVRTFLISRDSLPDQILELPINRTEYFLIENRRNWISPGVDIDSLRWANQRDDILPGYIETMIDFVDLETDLATGVIVSVPNYDLGLPGSGLLIWHVDETRIQAGLGAYSVNGDRERRGIDLEEADGAQDIGYPSPFPLVDPSSGLWSDMWFAGNTQYFVANPKGQPMSFGPHTFPDTRSNDGAHTHLEIDEIPGAGRVMSFILTNTLMASGFPDTTLHMRFLYDFDRDGTNEFIGGSDSLWWSPADSIVKTFFPGPGDDSIQLAVTNYETMDPGLAVVSASEFDEDGITLTVSVFRFTGESGAFEVLWSRTDHSEFALPPLVQGLPDDYGVNLNWGALGRIITEDTAYTYEGSGDFVTGADRRLEAVMLNPDDGDLSRTHASIDPNGGLKIIHDGFSLSGFENTVFSTLSAVDLDLDGEAEILCTDTAGYVYVLNSNLTLESGFPISLNAASAVLSGNLFGDDHPELVVQVKSGDLAVLTWKGDEQYRLSNPDGGELRMVGEYRGRSAIMAESSVWLFDSTGTTTGNQWSTIHHDPANTRTIRATLALRGVYPDRLIDKKRTYTYPNPAEAGTTTFRVFVESAERVEITIYDLAGYFVEKIRLESPRQGAVNEVVWNVSRVESGLYLANVTAGLGDRVESKILKIAVVH